jgi:hypothetical protein
MKIINERYKEELEREAKNFRRVRHDLLQRLDDFESNFLRKNEEYIK